MKVESINPLIDGRWDRFVEAHPLGQIGHLSGWQHVLENSFSHIKGHNLALLDAGGQNIVAGLSVYEVKSRLTGCRLVSTPFTTLCDPLVASHAELEPLLEQVLALAGAKCCKYIEIRCLNCNALIENDDFGNYDYYVNHFINLDTSLEKLQKSFHRTCVRQRIRRAEKSGLEILEGASTEDLESFYAIYVETRKRLKRPPLPLRFLKSIWHTFAKNGLATLLLARKDRQIIAGIIFFKFRERVTIEFAASLKGSWDFSPNHLLFWEAIKTAYNAGCEVVDFGRTSPKNTSLMDFKRHWGTKVVTMPYFYFPSKIAQTQINPEDSLQCRLIEKVCERLPKTVLPLLGDFCYRHLA